MTAALGSLSLEELDERVERAELQAGIQRFAGAARQQAAKLGPPRVG